MTVLDTSAAIDHLVDGPAAGHVQTLFENETWLAAPEILIFEVLAVLRRHVIAGRVPFHQADRAITDLADLRIGLFPTLPLRTRAWELRDNLTVADALFVALAEHLDEPLATKDRRLAAAARAHTGITVVEV